MAAVIDKFEQIGARARIRPWRELGIDVRSDRRGEFFELLVPGSVELEVLQARPRERHLVLLARGEDKLRFLCGHDERHWFAAAIPDNARVTTVSQAMDALKPPAARDGERRVRGKLRNRRRNPAYVRQGEWFFVTAPYLEVDDAVVLRGERLTRGGGSKPHVAEEAVRLGGHAVWVCPRCPEGLTPSMYWQLWRNNPDARRWGWRPMQRDADVFVRGRITHPDHRTVVLNGWHRVLMNTENESQARDSLVFLD